MGELGIGDKTISAAAAAALQVTVMLNRNGHDHVRNSSREADPCLSCQITHQSTAPKLSPRCGLLKGHSENLLASNVLQTSDRHRLPTSARIPTSILASLATFDNIGSFEPYALTQWRLQWASTAHSTVVAVLAAFLRQFRRFAGQFLRNLAIAMPHF
jgi:hypothetical protein